MKSAWSNIYNRFYIHNVTFFFVTKFIRKCKVSFDPQGTDWVTKSGHSILEIIARLACAFVGLFDQDMDTEGQVRSQENMCTIRPGICYNNIQGLISSYILVTGIYLVLLGVLMQKAVLLDGHRGRQGNRVRPFLPFLLTTALHPWGGRLRQSATAQSLISHPLWETEKKK